MNKSLKKILILLPVLILGFFFLREKHHEEYAHVSFKRLAGFALMILLLYSWFIIAVARKKQDSFIEGLIQSSFFVYVFMVLTLTGYFILFKEISSHDWWGKMVQRVETKNRVNLQPLKTIRIYAMTDKQVLGNFVMLLPLGIYLPVMYKKVRRVSGFIAVFFFCLLVSVGIELLQLITSYRSADIDDVILNTLGGCTGFIIYQVIRRIVIRFSP